MTYKIEKNIPLIGARVRSLKWIFVKDMEIGDSVLVTTRTEANSIRHALVRLGRKATQRAEESSSGPKLRVWRIA